MIKAGELGPEVSDTEIAVTFLETRSAVDDWLAATAATLLGTPVKQVLFRSGRIDAVYGLVTATGQQVLLKVHRQPVDLDGRRLVAQAQQLLADAGFPCARPLVGPVSVDGRVVSVETLLPEGDDVDGHDPVIRAAIADGLARQIAVLSAHPDLIARVGPPPAWCDYRHGAWGRTHDPYFDFSTTPVEYRWLQEFAQDASDVLTGIRFEAAPVAAHGDWYLGNLRFHQGRLVAAFDWDLIADQEAIIAGIAAATFAGESETGPPTPQEAAAFLADYEAARGSRFTHSERAAAVAAARWNIAYSARCDVTNAHGQTPPAQSALALLQSQRADYLDLSW